ncbi:hypothetical protein SAMN06297422_10769 [Lachnospiraceae bacterium]|nr:hypothetical protein SAMN06297422_10769 [Lachnospiraceae bacterium]
MSEINGKEIVPFYKKDSSYKTAAILALSGAGLLTLSTMFNWMVLYVKTTEASRGGISIFKSVYNAFQGMFVRDLENKIVEKNITVGGILPIVFLLLFYVLVLFLILAGINDNIKKKDFFVKKKKIVRISALILLIVLMILLTHTVSFRNSATQFKDSVSSWNSYIETSLSNHVNGADKMECKLYSGLGPYCFWIGIAVYFASIVYNFILDTLNEDEEPEQENGTAT